MNPLDTAVIHSWHAHVYFDAPRRDAAWALREAIGTALAGRMELGRFHERPVGPHPMWSYQLAFAPAQFAAVVAWLTLNRGALDVFVPQHRRCVGGSSRPRAVVGPLVYAEPDGAGWLIGAPSCAATPASSPTRSATRTATS